MGRMPVSAASGSITKRAERASSGTSRAAGNRWAAALVVALLSCHAVAPTLLAQTTFTYSYSNLFDDRLTRQSDFSEYEMLRAVEESLAVWAQHAPLTFVERPDSGPAVSDNDYIKGSAPDIRVGHHDLEGNTLGHAYFPAGFFSGLASDVHMDSSDRVWGEGLFYSTVLHELGHSLGVDHIDDQVSVMNSALGPTNTFNSLEDGRLYPPEITALQIRYGTGSGSVQTTRTWQGGRSTSWSDDANWAEGWHPTRYANVTLPGQAMVQVRDRDQRARSLLVSGASAGIEIPSQGQLVVAEDLVLGSTPVSSGGGSSGNARGGTLLAAGDPVRVLVPTSEVDQDRWFLPEFDDSTWTLGRTGVGYERGNGFEADLQTDLESQMYNRATSVYLRSEFSVEDPAAVDFLNLRMKYDDGFAAFLNGVRVTAANVPGTLAWNSVAPASRDDRMAGTYVAFDLSGQRDLLRSGRNVLAIQGLNNRANSSDLLLLPELSGGALESTLLVDGGLLQVEGDLTLAQVAGVEGRLRLTGGLASIGGQILRGAGSGEIQVEGGILVVGGGVVQARQLLLDGGQVESIRRLEGDLRHDAGRLVVADGFAASDLAAPVDPALEITGRLSMGGEATLELRVAADADPRAAALRAQNARVDGILRLRVSDDALDDLEPLAAGVTRQLAIVRAETLEGTFREAFINGEPLASTGDRGVFQRITTDGPHVFWNLYRAYAGDASGDGAFDSADLIQVFQFGQYEDAIEENSNWLRGDWNGDADFDSGDLIAAFQTGRFEQPAAARGTQLLAGTPRAVPEPVASHLLALGLATLVAGLRAPSPRRRENAGNA
jgi:hypothetical protein